MLNTLHLNKKQKHYYLWNLFSIHSPAFKLLFLEKTVQTYIRILFLVEFFYFDGLTVFRDSFFCRFTLSFCIYTSLKTICSHVIVSMKDKFKMKKSAKGGKCMEIENKEIKCVLMAFSPPGKKEIM